MKERSKKKDGKTIQGQRGSENESKDRNNSSESIALLLELQQLLLNIFKRDMTTPEAMSSVRDTIQEVKQHLYNRDFALAFGREEHLDAYAYRWSPSRALAYLGIFHEIMGLVRRRRSETTSLAHRSWPSSTSRRDAGPDSSVGVRLEHEEQPNVSEQPDSWKTTRVVCVGGGGGAEIVGLAGLARHSEDLLPRTANAYSHQPTGKGGTLSDCFSVVVVDVADWTRVFEKLASRITSPPDLPKYASEAMRATNRALVRPDVVNIKFERQDVLELTGDSLSHAFQEADLVTIMFTLNELFSSSITKTTHLLLTLTEDVGKGALLLVVDSPGSYSTISLGSEADKKADKKYPMKWLLDHTLLELTIEEDGDGRRPKWEKLIDEDSKWFRLDGRLQYPVDLENMRYQIHLFRKL